jgi:RNase P/RNase MRP subunit p30
MRNYVDLHLCPTLDDLQNARSMADILSETGTRTVGFVVPPDQLSREQPAMNVFKEAGLDVARRLDVRPRSRDQLLRDLQKFRNKYEIIAVECTTSSVSQVAVRDRRVDIVYFPKRERGNRFRSNLAKTCRAGLEFNISELIAGEHLDARLHQTRREVEAAAAASLTMIGSSGAANPLELRAPRDIAALLHLLGLPLQKALESVSENPLALVKRNRLKLAEPQLEEGVRIPRRRTK